MAITATPNQGEIMNQNLITDLVCINCDANLMADLAEDGALFDTAKGNGGTTGNLLTAFDCCGVDYNGFSALPYMPHIAAPRDGATDRVNTHLIAWFTVGSATVPVTSGPDDNFSDIVTIPLASAFTVDDEDGEAGLQFIYDTLDAHFGAGRWTNGGQGLRDDDSDTVGIDFDLNV